MSAPSLDWNRIDRAVDIMEQNGLIDVRAHGAAANAAAVDFKHPVVSPDQTTAHVFDSSVQVGPPDTVLDYTLRFPGIVDLPRAPAKDEIEVALTAAADPLPAGYRIDIVPRVRQLGDTTYAPHIRGDENPGVGIFQFARMAAQAQERFYDRVF